MALQISLRQKAVKRRSPKKRNGGRGRRRCCCRMEVFSQSASGRNADTAGQGETSGAGVRSTQRPDGLRTGTLDGNRWHAWRTRPCAGPRQRARCPHDSRTTTRAPFELCFCTLAAAMTPREPRPRSRREDRAAISTWPSISSSARPCAAATASSIVGGRYVHANRGRGALGLYGLAELAFVAVRVIFVFFGNADHELGLISL